jgi:uncharacterized protein (DUF983 family)
MVILRSPENFIMRLIGILALSAIVVACGFGFMATFEPPGWPMLRIVYLAVVVGCLLGIGRLLFARKLSS